jgi:WD40 repeat protein
VAQGRSPKWSPDGKRIAFLNENGVSILDLETDAIHELFLREDHPYQDLGSDIAWSPDSQRLAVLGNFAATSQLLILATDAAKPGLVRIRYSFDVPCRSNLNWTDQDEIVLAIRAPKLISTQLFSLSVDSDREPAGVGPFDQKPGVRSACLTPDGQWYITVVEE